VSRSCIEARVLDVVELGVEVAARGGEQLVPGADRLAELEQVIARAEERRGTLRRQVEMADEFIEALRGQRGDATGR
jgi:hypothetical protein